MGLHNRFPMAEWIAARIQEDNFEGFVMEYASKKPDGLLHPSTDLGCEIEMCHGQDPDIGVKPKDLANKTTLLVGTLMHAFLMGAWQSGDWEGVEARCETKMAEGLPPGWQGSADVLLGQFGDGKLSEAEWTLFDYKTIKGSNVQYIDLDNPKIGYWKQASAYYHAAVAMGYKMNPEICISYIPVSAPQWKGVPPPFDQWCTPLPKDKLFGEMRKRSRIVKAYNGLKAGKGDYDEKLLPKQMPLVETQKYNKKTKKTEVRVGPDWLVKYCNSPLCACAGQTSQVVAYLEDGDVAPQDGAML